MALTKIGATLGGSADVIQVTQSSHGLSLGYPVKVSGNGTYAHATADTAANAEAIGVIIATTTDTMTIALGGRITVDGVLPSGNLPAGTVLFLHTSAGKLTATEPSGNNEVSKAMAVITYLNSEMIMIQQRGEVISTAGVTLADESVDSDHYVDASIDNEHLADGAVDTQEIANDAVTYVKMQDLGTADRVLGSTSTGVIGEVQIVPDMIASDAVTTVKILDDQVTYAKLQDLGTANRLLGGTSTGTIGEVQVNAAMINTSAGTAGSGTFLRGDMQWQAAGGGSLTLIGSTEATDDGDITITGLDETVYDAFLLIGSDLHPASDGQPIQLRVGDSGGIDSGGSDYSYHVSDVDPTSGSYQSNANSAGDADIRIGTDGSGFAAGEGFSFTLTLTSGSKRPTVHGTYSLIGGAGTLFGGTIIGARLTVITLTQVQISFETGNIISGRFSVWGLAHA